MTFLICSRQSTCAEKGKNVYRSAHTSLIRYECRDDVLDGPFDEHTSDKTKAFAIRFLGECSVESS